MLTRETFTGEKLDNPVEFLAKGIAPKFLPFAVQNFINPGPGEEPGVATFIPETLGLRARPLGAFERLEVEQDRIAQEIHGLPWESTRTQSGLDVDQQRAIEANNPELRRLKDLSRINSDPAMAAFFERIDEDRLWAQDKIITAAKEYISTGERNGRTFRQKYDDAVRQQFNNRQRREDPEGQFAEAIKRLGEKDAREADLLTQFDRLVEEYTVEVREHPLTKDAFGNPDFRQMRKLEDAFKKKVGDEVFQRIRNHYRKIDENGEPLKLDYPEEEFVVQLRHDRDLLNEVGYWSLADDLIGDDTALWDAWRNLEASDSAAIRDAIKRTFPALRRIERQVSRKRQIIRRGSAAVDAALIRWYGFSAMNVENRRMQRAVEQQERQRLAAG